MAYDPQANRRRPHPEASEPAPVEALLGGAGIGSRTPGPIVDDPPPSPGVTPAPADPPSDTVLIKTTVAVITGAIVALLLLRHLWNRRMSRAES